MEVLEQFEGMDASIDTESGSFTRKFNVTFNQNEYPAQQTPLIARDAAGVPLVWDVHPYDPWLYVNNKRVIYRSATNYDVIVHYTSISDPLTIDPEVSFASATTNEPVDKDILGKPITNSSHELFDPPTTEDYHDIVLRVTRNEPSFNPVLANDYLHSYSNDLFLGFPPGQARVKVFDGTRARAGQFYYYQVTYEIQFRYEGWKKKITDLGFRTIKIDDSSNPILLDDKYTYTELKDADGKALTQPRHLNGSGQLLKSTEDIAYMEYETLYPMSYANLNLEVVL